MWKVVLAALAAALVLAGGEASGSPAAKQDLSIPMDDGTSIAATLYLPDGSAPSGGWPAIVFLHGLSGNRQQMNALVEGYGLTGQSYAVLTFDARGHGESGGLVGIDGPREVADTRAVHDWLAARPDVSDTKIGAWGISYGGGAVFNSLVAGVPWAAVVTVETWTDLFTALAPQGLVKSGLVAGLASSIPDARRDPTLAALTLAAFAGDTTSVRPWAAARSSISKLGSVTTPVFMAQGRRDFLFGIDQGTRAFQRLKGPKVLYVGLHGHAPSTFPAADTGFLMTKVRAWFDCYLRATGCDGAQASVYVAPETLRRPGRAPWDAATGVADLRLVPWRHDLRTEREGRPRRCSAAQGDRGLRRADRADDDRSERRLVEARGRAHGPHAGGEGDRRERRGCPDEERSSEGHDPAPQSGDVRPEGLAADTHPRVLLDRTVDLQPALPRPPDGGERPRTCGHCRPEAARSAHTGHQVTGGAAAVVLVALALAASAGAAPAADPGVSPTTVLLGGTVPLTGEAAAFGTVGPGAKAYFARRSPRPSHRFHASIRR